MTITSPFQRFNTAPKASGLYDPSRDRDACGLAMVATLRGTAGHDIVETAMTALRNLEHRGAVGSDAGTLTDTHAGREHTQGEARVHAHHNSAYSESED